MRKRKLIGNLTKRDNLWFVRSPIRVGEKHTGESLYPVYQQDFNIDKKQSIITLEEGKQVEFQIEKLWETGFEEKFIHVAILHDSSDPFVSDDFQIGPDGAYEHTDLDEFYYHELLDRLSIIYTMIDSYLVEHPVCEFHPNLRSLILNSQEILIDAYSELGGIRFAYNSKEGLGENREDLKNKLDQISSDIQERNSEIKYEVSDITDLGKEIGISVGKVIEDIQEDQIEEFVRGFKNGISLKS